jgi:hypothetical protein
MLFKNIIIEFDIFFQIKTNKIIKQKSFIKIHLFKNDKNVVLLHNFETIYLKIKFNNMMKIIAIINSSIQKIFE